MRIGVPDRAAADWSDGAERIRPDTPRSNDRSTDDLARRLESLPDGHPSSPYDANGARREPPARLREFDTEPSPDVASHSDELHRYTDAEWVEHKTEVRAHLGDAHQQKLDTHHQFTIGPDNREWTWERNRIQGHLVADLYGQAKNVPCDGRAIIAGGLGGAGKTTVLEEHANIDLSQYLVINPDNIKEEMARRGLIPEVDGLSPMEASELVHEEASFIAKRLALRATADHRNVIWDITMSSLDSVNDRIGNLRSADYSVEGIFVDIPIEVSIRRADGRHRDGEDKFRAGEGLGGRYVPPEVTLAQADSDWGSQNRRTFEAVKPGLDHWSLFDNGVDGRAAVRVAESPRNDDPQEAEK